jgi:hypothetical protein
MGQGALDPVILTGYGNTAAGYQALYNNTSGVGNTAVGEFALIDVGTGSKNVAIGYAALYSNVADANVAVGSGA